MNLIFTEEEIKYCKNKKEPYISFAGKFCAKEAVIKAYGKKIPFTNMEINAQSGKPAVYVNGKKRRNIQYYYR